jgi:hypothetical protein
MVLKNMFLLCTVFFVCISTVSAYAVAQSIPDKQISLVGKITVDTLPQHEKSTHSFIRLFLPKDAISYHLDKDKARFMHVSKNVTSFSGQRHVAEAMAALAAPKMIAGFDGLNQTQCDCVPPDVQVAAGPHDIVEMVNADMGIWTINGTSESSILLDKLFATQSSDILSDPRVIFDKSSDRWYSSVLDVTTSHVGIAVSTSDDPTKSWNVYTIQFDNNCPDQPSIGISGDKFVVSANDFTDCLSNPSFVGSQYFVIDKHDLIVGAQNPAMQKFGPDGSTFSMFPVQSLDSISTLFMVNAYGNNNILHLYSLVGTVPNVTVAQKDLVIQTINVPPGAVQRNTTIPIDTADDRIQSAVFDGGTIWLGLNDGCTPQGDVQARSCVRLVELDTAGPTVIQDFDIGNAGFYYFYPALTVDLASGLNLALGYSSQSDYPGLMFATQDSSVGSNGIAKPEIFKQGAWYDSTGRYGDYFGASSDKSYAWFAGEYHKDKSPLWSTYIATTNPDTIPEFPYSVVILGIAMFSFIILLKFQARLHVMP